VRQEDLCRKTQREGDHLQYSLMFQELRDPALLEAVLSMYMIHSPLMSSLNMEFAKGVEVEESNSSRSSPQKS